MMDDMQHDFFEIIKIEVKNNHLSHAYLIETNDYEDADNLALAFVKELFKLSVNDNDEFINVSTLFVTFTLPVSYPEIVSPELVVISHVK